jgi:hypothetical protein
MEWLLLPTLPMRTLVLLAVAIIALAGLALATFGSAVVPEAVPSKTPNRSMAGSRFFMLLPDGMVEITDAWTRRVYRWDGRQWLQVDVSQAATTPAEMR